MNFRVGACALLVCLVGCSAEAPETRSGVASTGASTQRHGQKLPSVQLDRKASESVANAPDRGALIQYKNKGVATKQEGAYTWYPIAMSEAHAIKAVVTGEMTVPAPDGSQIKLKYERHEEQTDGNWTWIGRVVGGDQRRDAILTFGEKAVFGTIPQLSGAPLSVQTIGGALFAVKTDLSKVKNPNIAATDMMVPPALALRSRLLASAPAVKASGLVTPKAGTPSTTVDVAIGYTQGFASVYGGQSGAVTKLVNLVAVGNAAFNNSLITGALRLVNAVQVNYPDNTSNQTALEDLTGVRNQQPITVPAGLAPLRTAREQYGADLAILVRKFQAPENQGCGIAWLNGAGGEPINPAVDDDYAFAIVSEGYDADGNNNYFCAPESLVHEVGHLMGSAHDRDNSKVRPNDPPGGTNLLYGRYPYSFGMKTSASNGNFYTIMSYGDDNQNGNPVFSNPLVLKCGPTGATLACGVANQTDNARSLNQTIPVVATFRATVVPIDNVALNLYAIKKNGVTKTELRGLSRATTFQTYSSNNATLLGKTGNDESWAFAMGLYNGDTKADLYAIKKNGASGKTEVHVLNGANGFTTYLTNVATILGQTGANNAWDFKVADYNRDGKRDLYAIKKQGAGNKVEVRVLNGANNFQTYLLSVQTAVGPVPLDYSYQFELADYNGDGNPDLYVIKKVSGTGKTEVQVLDAVGGFKNYLVSRASILGQTGTDNAWDFKVGDYNRDGFPDVYGIKKNGASGKTEVFVMNGANQFQSYLVVTSTILGATGSDASWKFALAP